jgi:serine/threonine protein kinase
VARGQDGRIAGKYLLREKIGEGAMGVVWRAHDESLGRDVAIKEIRFPAGMPEDEVGALEARTLREARAAAKLSGHPGIVVVHEVVHEDGRPWIVMELVRGPTLEQLVRTDGPLPPRQVAAIGASVLAGLRAAHAAGIVHRDVKPSNVMFDGERTIITDFGIAALDGGTVLTHSGTVMGTPAFMAPEQARGEYATPATDLWALGATLYYAAEGRPPFQAASVAAVLVAVLTVEPLLPVLAGPLAPVLAGLLVKDPAGRTAAPALAEQLALVAAGREVPPTLRLTEPVPPTKPPRRRVSRLGAAALGAGLAAVVLVVALIWLPDRWRSEAGPPANSGSDSTSDGATATATATVTVTATPTQPPRTTHTITYKVGGTSGRADVTYSTPSGSEQHDIDVPWQTSFKADEEDFDFPQVLAGTKGGGTRTITCEIYVDGVRVKSGKSIGEFKNVTCRGGL